MFVTYGPDLEVTHGRRALPSGCSIGALTIGEPGGAAHGRTPLRGTGRLSIVLRAAGVEASRSHRLAQLQLGLRNCPGIDFLTWRIRL